MSPSATIAHYRIASKLGEGGMGAVYRATDTKLNRDVAIKVLPPAFADDAARMARFEREAQVLASLNHPNIAAIYGVEERALIMELVEGEELKGPVPLDTAIELARQIAEALDAAHDKGITHRDLKPANIKVTPQGVVKVLDFGLAKVAETAAGSPQSSPTLTIGATQAGVIMGTAAYMAPEQARGQAVDQRADIWAFGVILWELLTGRPLFEGDTVSDVLANVLKHQPDLSIVPPRVRTVLAACLEKDPRKRLRHVADWHRLLAEETAPAISVAERKTVTRKERIVWIGACAVLVSLCGFLFYRATMTRPLVTRLHLLPPEGARFSPRRTYLAVAPDGRRVAYITNNRGNQGDLWIQEFDSPTARQVPERGQDPFWAPDSRSLAYFSSGALRRFDLASGATQTICAAPGARGGTWNQDGVIVFAPQASGPLYRVSATGGEPAPVTTLENAGGAIISHRHPWFLPDGKHFLYLARAAGQGSIEWAELGSQQHGKVIDSTPAAAVYSEPGLVLYLRGETLMALPFDARSMKKKGEAFPVAEHVAFQPVHAKGNFAVSSNGVLVFASGTPTAKQLRWVDLAGADLGTFAKPYTGGRSLLSPDGTKVVQEIENTQTGVTSLWLTDVARATSIRLSSESVNQANPVWSPDGQMIAYTTVRAGRPVIVTRPASGTGAERVIFQSPFTNTGASSWSPDGHWLLVNGFGSSTSVWLVPVREGEKPSPFLSDDQVQLGYAQVSPDGKWIAYWSTESGTDGIYVSDFPEKRTKVQVATDANFPQWSRDGKTLFYEGRAGQIQAVPVKGGVRLEVGTPRIVYQGHMPAGFSFDVAPDGKRLLLATSVQEEESNSATVVLNWNANIGR